MIVCTYCIDVDWLQSMKLTGFEVGEVVSNFRFTTHEVSCIFHSDFHQVLVF